MSATDTAPVEVEADQVWIDSIGTRWQVWGVFDGKVDLDRIPGFQDRSITIAALHEGYVLEVTS